MQLGEDLVILTEDSQYFCGGRDQGYLDNDLWFNGYLWKGIA